MSISAAGGPAVVEKILHAPIENLAFEGGGVKGIVYLGALQHLKEQNVLQGIKRVGGSSAGGITALLVGLGYTLPEIENIMTGMDFTQFQDTGDTFWQQIPPELDVLHLNEKVVKKIEEAVKIATDKQHGLYKGDVFLNWARAKVAEKLGNPDATFADLREAMKVDPSLKEMMFTATNISGNGPPLQYFDIYNTPNVKIADAVRATMSFPGAFAAYPIEINGVKSIFVDGGVVNNYPIEYYDDPKFLPEGDPANNRESNPSGTNPRSLGFRVDDKTEVSDYKWRLRGGKAANTTSLKGWAVGLAGAPLSDRTKVYQRGFNTIQIPDCGVDTLNFKLNELEIKQLRESGLNATTDFFSFYRAGSIADIKKYQDLYAAYSEKVSKPNGVEELKLKKEALLKELFQISGQTSTLDNVTSGTETEQKAFIEEQKRIHALLWEHDIVSRCLQGREKSKELSVIESVEKLLLEQAKVAEKNQQDLLVINQNSQKLLEELQKLHLEYHKEVSVVSVVKENPVGRAILIDIFDEIKKLHRVIYDIKLRQATEKDPMILMDIEVELKMEKRKGVNKIKEKLAKDLREIRGEKSIIADLGEENAGRLERIILNEVMLVSERKEPRTLDQFEQDIKLTENNANKMIAEMGGALKGQEKQIAQNNKTLQRLQFERKSCGKNLDKMLNLSNKLTNFINSQNGLGTFVCKWARRAAKAVGTVAVLYPVYLVIRSGIKHFAKEETYQNLKKFERKFYTNQEIYVKHAKKLRGETNTLLKEWSAGRDQGEYNPKENIEKYIGLLEGTKDKAEHGHYEKMFYKDTKTKFDEIMSEASKDVEVEKDRPESKPEEGGAAPSI